jgi:glycosyltransferase involved in cell wall biosynthesis
MDEGAKVATEAGKQRGRLARGRHRPDVPDSPLGERAQKWIMDHNVEHLHGPEEVDYEVDELVVLVQLYNGKPYVKPLLEHYFSLGAKHVVFLDNGSSDGTVDVLRDYDNVTVLRTGLPYKTYNVAMKRYLVERFGRGRWTLSVDQDELFEYPYSDVVSLKALLKYLSENSYTAVVAYMLDMFPERLSEDDPLTEYASLEQLKETNRFYDISEVIRASYHDIGDIGNVLANEEVGILRGGVRGRLFGIHALLTKHPLVFLDEKLRPMDLSDHWAGNARVADFTGVLLHYKLSNSLYEMVRHEVRERRNINRKKDRYGEYLKVLEQAPSLVIKDSTSKELKSVNELVGTAFVAVSRQYMGFVESEGRRRGHRTGEISSETMFEPFFNARVEATSYSAAAQREREEAQRTRERAQRTREEAQRARERAQRAEEQIQAIRSSRSWKALTALGRLKNGVWRGILRATEKARSASEGRD